MNTITTTPNNRLEGSAAFVLGGSRGIGAAVAKRLAAEGANVALTYRTDEASAEALVKEITATGRDAVAMRVDAADPAAVSGAVTTTAERFGRLDVVVANAALYPMGPLDQAGVDEFDTVMAANVRAPFVAATTAAAHLTDGGAIIVIGSNVAERLPFPGLGLYATSKAALTGLVKGLARDFGSRGIRANIVQPGPTDTDLNPADGPHADAIRALTAAGRYAQPDEVAATVAHLAGPDGVYITGTTVRVDGGFTV